MSARFRSSPGRRAVLWIGPCLAAGLVLALALARGPSPGGAALAGPLASAAGVAAPDGTWSSRGVALLVRPEPVVASTRVEVAPFAAEPAAPDAERVMLRLHARGLGSANAPRSLEVHVAPVCGTPEDPRLFDGHSLWLSGDDVRRLFEGEPRLFDISALFRFGAPHSLVVRAEGGGLAALEQVPCGEGVRELTAELWLAPGVRTEGSVFPAEPRQVAAFLMLGERPTTLLADEGVVGSDGSFELVLPGGHDYAVCVFGPGRPGTLLARLGRGATQVLPVLHLPPEARIQGGIGFGFGLPWERGSVSAELVGGSGTYSVGVADFTWYEGAFEWRARERGLGRYELLELDGLAPAVYELSVSGVAGPERVAVGRLPAIRVRAPALAVDIAPRVARVRFQAESDGAPVAGFRLPLVQDFGTHGSSHLQGVTDERGIAEFWLDPDAPAWTLAKSEGGCGKRFVPRERDGGAPCSVLLAEDER